MTNSMMESTLKETTDDDISPRRESLQGARPDYLTSLRRNSVATLLEDTPFKQSFRNISNGLELNQVEVRLKNYSRTVSVRKDAPSIKTVFNTSPCYVAMELVRNVGEIITGTKKVGYLHHVLSICCAAANLIVLFCSFFHRLMICLDTTRNSTF